MVENLDLVMTSKNREMNRDDYYFDTVIQYMVENLNLDMASKNREMNRDDYYFDTVVQYMVENLDLDMTYKNREISVHGTASIKVYLNKFPFFLH